MSLVGLREETLPERERGGTNWICGGVVNNFVRQIVHVVISVFGTSPAPLFLLPAPTTVCQEVDDMR